MSNSKNISFSTRVYDREVFSSVIDKSFKEFGQKSTGSQDRTVEQFFQDYEDLYFEIPVKGDTGSHQYLVEKSSQLYQLSQSLMDIQPLLEEITQLRNQNIQDQQTIVDLRLKLAKSGETSI